MLNKIRKIKWDRLKDEEKWFLNILYNAEEVILKEDIGISLFKYNNIPMFFVDYYTNEIYINYNNIWVILTEIYKYSNKDLNTFIIKMFRNHFNGIIVDFEGVSAFPTNTMEEFFIWWDI